MLYIVSYCSLKLIFEECLRKVSLAKCKCADYSAVAHIKAIYLTQRTEI